MPVSMENSAPQKRAKATSDIINILVTLDASDRDAVLHAVRALIATAPAHTQKISGGSLGGLLPDYYPPGTVG